MIWLKAGTPAHWIQLAALLGYALIEWVLPRIKSIKANSVFEMIANMLAPILGRIPLVAAVIKAIASPEVASALKSPPPQKAKGAARVGLLFILAVSGAAFFLSLPGCATMTPEQKKAAIGAATDPSDIACTAYNVAKDMQVIRAGMSGWLEAGVQDAQCASAVYDEYKKQLAAASSAAPFTPTAQSLKIDFKTWKPEELTRLKVVGSLADRIVKGAP